MRHIKFPDDEIWLKDLLLRKYSDNYDVVTTESWVRHVVLPNPHLFYAVRTDHAFVLTGLRSTPWTPNDIEAVVSIVTADDGHVWDCIHLLRDSVDWARRRKAVQWSAFSETGVDLGPLMERIGCHLEPRFVVSLRGE